MSKQEIIDYVMTTPGNTNKAILGQMLDGMSENSSKFYTKKWIQLLPYTYFDFPNGPTETIYLEKKMELHENFIYYVILDGSKHGILCKLSNEGEPYLYIDYETEHYQIFSDRISGNYPAPIEVYGTVYVDEATKEDLSIPTLDFTEVIPIINLNKTETLTQELSDILSEEEINEVNAKLFMNDQVRIAFRLYPLGRVYTLCKIDWKEDRNFVNVYASGDWKIGQKCSFILSSESNQLKFTVTPE